MLYGSAAAIAGIAGATMAWWKFQPHQVDASPCPEGTGSSES